MVVDTVIEPTFERGKPRVLLEGSYETLVTGIRNYDVTRDGERLLVMALTAPLPGESTAPQIHVVLNWFEELERLAPTEN